MALTATTLTGATTVDQTVFAVASATGILPGVLWRCDDEQGEVQDGYVAGSLSVPVLRGREGTNSTTHPTAAKIVFGNGSDFSAGGAQTSAPYILAGKGRYIASYSASGAITLPVPGDDQIAILNGTGVLAMTLANPTADMDGCILIIAGNGKAAHTVTYAAGFGNVGATSDVMTFGTTQAQAFQCIAVGGFWCLLGPLGVATVNVTGPIPA